MNALDRHDLIIPPEGADKVTTEKDTKIQNASTFKILCEDHTLGNLVKQELLTRDGVMFAGYRMPHPLKAEMLIKVQASSESNPTTEFLGALGEIRTRLDNIEDRFKEEVEKFRLGRRHTTRM